MTIGVSEIERSLIALAYKEWEYVTKKNDLTNIRHKKELAVLMFIIEKIDEELSSSALLNQQERDALESLLASKKLEYALKDSFVPPQKDAVKDWALFGMYAADQIHFRHLKSRVKTKEERKEDLRTTRNSLWNELSLFRASFCDFAKSFLNIAKAKGELLQARISDDRVLDIIESCPASGNDDFQESIDEICKKLKLGKAGNNTRGSVKSSISTGRSFYRIFGELEELE